MREEHPHRLRVRETYDTTYFNQNDDFCFTLKKCHNQPMVFHKKPLLQILAQDPEDPAFLMVILKDDHGNTEDVLFLDMDIDLFEDDLRTDERVFDQDDIECLCEVTAEHINKSGDFEKNIWASPMRIFHHPDEKDSILFARDKHLNKYWEFHIPPNSRSFGMRGPIVLN